MHTEDGEWPLEATRRMSRSPVKPDKNAPGVERGQTMCHRNVSSEEKHPVADAASLKYHCLDVFKIDFEIIS